MRWKDTQCLGIAVFFECVTAEVCSMGYCYQQCLSTCILKLTTHMLGLCDYFQMSCSVVITVLDVLTVGYLWLDDLHLELVWIGKCIFLHLIYRITSLAKQQVGVYLLSAHLQRSKTGAYVLPDDNAKN